MILSYYTVYVPSWSISVLPQFVGGKENAEDRINFISIWLERQRYYSTLPNNSWIHFAWGCGQIIAHILVQITLWGGTVHSSRDVHSPAPSHSCHCKQESIHLDIVPPFAIAVHKLPFKPCSGYPWQSISMTCHQSWGRRRAKLERSGCPVEKCAEVSVKASTWSWQKSRPLIILNSNEPPDLYGVVASETVDCIFSQLLYFFSIREY